MALLTLKNNDIDTFYLYNLTLKKYNDNLVKCKKTSFDIQKFTFRENQHNGTMTEEELSDKSRKYLKLVKTNIIDLAYNNKDKFNYFVTLTFDFKNEVYEHEKAIEKLKKWVNNMKKQNKNMAYILVPEFHQSGRLHFHGLFGNVPNWHLSKAYYPSDYKTVHLRGKPIIKCGCQIYNLDNYDMGFTTVSKIKSSEKVSVYISKYATKDLITLKSKKRYWYSRNLEKPKIIYDYIDTTLEEHFKNENVLYNNIFSTKNREIELLTYQLPIIDIE